jgi:predicted transcriptional regulator
MQINNYIVNDIKPLKLSHSIDDVKKRFQELVLTHIPIVEDGHFLGLIPETELVSLDEGKTVLNDVNYLFQTFFIDENANWIKLLKYFAINETNIIPVLNKDNIYIGYIELVDVLTYLNSTPFLNEDGTVIIISKDKTDYSMSEIAQIIESNDSKLLGIFISEIDKKNVEFTIKLSCQKLNEVVHAFRRYGYSIVLGIDEDDYLNNLKERSEYLQKYLNI